MSVRGKITKWNNEKGFGFITPSSGGNQVFVHIKALPRGVKHPQVGTDVTYETVNDAQSRTRAESVSLTGGQQQLIAINLAHSNSHLTVELKRRPQ